MSMLDAQQPTVPVSTHSTISSYQHTIIDATRGSLWAALRDLWDYRELLYFLVWRDVKVRYKQTLLGVLWAIIQPVMTMLVFTIFFGRLAKISSDGFPYPIFNYAGLLPWQFFALALTSAANSLVGSAGLVRKVYFPRIAIPIASVLGGLVDFGVSFVVLLGLMLFYQVVPTLSLLLLPLFLLLAIITALGIGLWLAALNAQYRDIRYAVPFLVQFWLFATPVVYPASLLDERWRTIYGLNPMAGVVEGFRWALLGSNPPSTMIMVSALMSLVLLVTGTLYFQSVERKLADVI